MLTLRITMMAGTNLGSLFWPRDYIKSRLACLNHYR
jgi:hypothetical protein